MGRYADCGVRNEKPHSHKRCDNCGHYVAHHWRYRYCQECDEHDAQYDDGSACDRKPPKTLTNEESKDDL